MQRGMSQVGHNPSVTTDGFQEGCWLANAVPSLQPCANATTWARLSTALRVSSPPDKLCSCHARVAHVGDERMAADVGFRDARIGHAKHR